MKNISYILIILAVSIFASCTEADTKDKTKGEKSAKKLPTPEIINSDPYLEKGAKLAKEIKQLLGSNLMAAMKEGGPVHAISFCNEKALILTDSLAKDISVKRVSDKYRNSGNKADELELSYINKMKKAIAESNEIKPQIQEIDNHMVAYYPIVTQAKCMQCHGQASSEVAPETLTKINELYPEDKAVNYSVGDLRGIWVVKMNK